MEHWGQKCFKCLKTTFLYQMLRRREHRRNRRGTSARASHDDGRSLHGRWRRRNASWSSHSRRDLRLRGIHAYFEARRQRQGRAVNRWSIHAKMLYVEIQVTEKCFQSFLSSQTIIRSILHIYNIFACKLSDVWKLIGKSIIKQLGSLNKLNDYLSNEPTNM